jgi:hypothetical protein
MWNFGLVFVSGAVLGPLLKKMIQPVAKSAIRTGFAAKQYVEEVVAEVHEDFEDVKAEIAAEQAPKKARTTN